MKTIKNILSVFVLITITTSLWSCVEIDEYLNGDTTGPTIIVDNELLSYDELNEGDMIRIPLVIKSEYGIKRIAWFLNNETPNGVVADDPVYIDNDEFPKEIVDTINVPVSDNAKELVIICFDKRNRSSEIHVAFNTIKTIPQIIFKDSINSRASVFENKNFTVTGRIVSEYELKSTTVSTIINGVTSSEQTLTLQDTRFTTSLMVVKGLTGIIIKATNINDGVAVDTFKIGAVVDDAVNILMKGGITSLQSFAAGEINSYEGSVVSGSNISKLVYKVRKNDVYGNEINIALGTPLDEFIFKLEILGEEGMQSVQIIGENVNGKTTTIELTIPEVILNVLYFKDVQLTTEIGAGKKNWFACYRAPYAFDQASAAANQEMMDFVCALYDNTQVSLLSPHVFNASQLYNEAITPYMQGFTQANFCLLSGNRPEITFESFNAIKTQEDLDKFIDTSIAASYTIYTANRGTNRELVVGKGMVYAWGPSSGNNKEFGIIIVKAISFTNGIGNVTLDIKVPRADYRTVYSASAKTYP